MFGNYFYNESMRRMTIAFGQLFNNIQIKRKDSSDTVIQSIRVPLSYAPKEKFLVRLDQLSSGDENIVIINNEASSDENFPDFEEGIDFLDGLDENHNIEYPNLRYPQIKWDGRSLEYYIDSNDGQFIQKVSEAHEYENNISTPGYGEVPDSEVVK